jgi:hypothetical protein
MLKGAAGRGSVPVYHVGLNFHYVAFAEPACGFAFFLIIAFA